MGNDVPDFKADSNPKDHMGPFIMNPEGVGRIFGPLAAFADGPFPEHYEPFESPITNPLHPNQQTNPVVKKFTTPADKYGTTKDGFNIICTTYRLTEHYHYWTKNNPMNVCRDSRRTCERSGNQGRRQRQSHECAELLRRQGIRYEADQAHDG